MTCKKWVRKKQVGLSPWSGQWTHINGCPFRPFLHKYSEFGELLEPLQCSRLAQPELVLHDFPVDESVTGEIRPHFFRHFIGIISVRTRGALHAQEPHPALHVGHDRSLRTKQDARGIEMVAPHLFPICEFDAPHFQRKITNARQM